MDKNIDPSLIITDEIPWSDLDNAYKKLLSRDESPFTYILTGILRYYVKIKICCYWLWKNGSIY